MIYKVTKQFATGSEQLCQNFKKVENAKTFITEHAESDASMRIKTVYRLYEFDDVIDTVDSSKVEISRPTEESSGGRSAGSMPTPLAMAPQPKGALPKWMKDKDKDDDKKDK